MERGKERGRGGMEKGVRGKKDKENDHLFGHNNVMPCLRPTKCGHAILRNDVQRELRHT